MLIVETAIAILVSRIKPVGPNDGEQHVALADLHTKHLDEVHAQRDSVHVHEQQIPAELPREPVVHPSGVPRAVVAPVADENLAWHSCEPRSFPRATDDSPAFIRLSLGGHRQRRS